jgi:hypothetical protein
MKLIEKIKELDLEGKNVWILSGCEKEAGKFKIEEIGEDYILAESDIGRTAVLNINYVARIQTEFILKKK